MRWRFQSAVVALLGTGLVGCAAAQPRTASLRESRQAEIAAAAANVEAELSRELSPAVRAAELDEPPPPPPERPCLAEVYVTTGGIILDYSGTSSEEALDAGVRQMAALHNHRFADASAKGVASPATVRSVALVEDQGHGSRIVLLADDALDAADLYSHLETDAPDLIPTGSLEQGSCSAARSGTPLLSAEGASHSSATYR